MFKKVMARVVAHLHMLGVSVFPYLEDLLLKADSPQKVISYLQTTERLLHTLRFTINVPKSHLTPSQRLPFIEAVPDTVQFRAYPPDKRVQDIQAMILIFQPLSWVSVRLTLRLLGLMASCILLVTHARCCYAFSCRPVYHRAYFLCAPTSFSCGGETLPSDPKRAFAFYLNRTKDFRVDDQLFVGYVDVKKGKVVQKRTISRWILLCFNMCYALAKKQPPEDLHAHSTRATAASTALARGLPVLDISQAAMWAFLHTFAKHYCLDSQVRRDGYFS
ncbi:hypothetical protein NDU88_002618 [Pleurodeles waltl]|uniref:Uncharacterized protein n=1 Tax=Pleurodeles waltl TaxID=8319 RepID=A0AAV7M147_PLEWA|nr:hypothetical protein NDU88_002618 [Pleurodeles waltl]